MSDQNMRSFKFFPKLSNFQRKISLLTSAGNSRLVLNILLTAPFFALLSCSAGPQALAAEPAEKVIAVPTQQDQAISDTAQSSVDTTQRTANESGDNPFARCPQGRQVRAALITAGANPPFTELLNLILNDLKQRKLTLTGRTTMLPTTFPSMIADGYQQLVRESRDDCLSFVSEGLFNAEWERPRIAENVEQLLKHAEAGDFDFVIAAGTVPGLYLSSRKLTVPTVLIKARAPEINSISRYGDFSDNPLLHVLKEPKRVTTELHMYYDTFRFKNLGVVLSRDRDLQLAQGIRMLQDVSEDRSFDLEICYGDIFDKDIAHARDEYERCLLDLANRSDAVYLTEHLGIDHDHYYEQIKPLLDAKLPTFAQSGIDEVDKGALMSMSSNENQTLAAFEADVIERILKGEDIRSIPQYCYTTQRMYLNLKTARTIGWRPPFSILSAVDVVFHSFDVEHQRRTSSFSKYY